MILDFYGCFCDKDTSNCHTISPYRCDYPDTKVLYARSITPIEPMDVKIQSIIFQFDVQDKFRRFYDGTWKVFIKLNDKYDFYFEEMQMNHRDTFEYRFDVDNLDLKEFLDGINVKCRLLINNEIACPLFLDIIIITEE